MQCGRPGFDPWVEKIPWRRRWQPTSVFLPGKSHGWRSLAGYSPWGHKESDMTVQLMTHILIPYWFWQCCHCLWGKVLREFTDCKTGLVCCSPTFSDLECFTLLSHLFSDLAPDHFWIFLKECAVEVLKSIKKKLWKCSVAISLK